MMKLIRVFLTLALCSLVCAGSSLAQTANFSTNAVTIPFNTMGLVPGSVNYVTVTPMYWTAAAGVILLNPPQSASRATQPSMTNGSVTFTQVCGIPYKIQFSGYQVWETNYFIPANTNFSVTLQPGNIGQYLQYINPAAFYYSNPWVTNVTVSGGGGGNTNALDGVINTNTPGGVLTPDSHLYIGTNAYHAVVADNATAAGSATVAGSAGYATNAGAASSGWPVQWPASAVTNPPWLSTVTSNNITGQLNVGQVYGAGAGSANSNTFTGQLNAGQIYGTVASAAGYIDPRLGITNFTTAGGVQVVSNTFTHLLVASSDTNGVLTVPQVVGNVIGSVTTATNALGFSSGGTTNYFYFGAASPQGVFLDANDGNRETHDVNTYGVVWNESPVWSPLLFADRSDKPDFLQIQPVQ